MVRIIHDSEVSRSIRDRNSGKEQPGNDRHHRMVDAVGHCAIDPALQVLIIFC